MTNKRYILHLDILGFERLAAEIASQKGIKSKIVREHFMDVIRERVAAIEAEGKIAGKHYGGSDDWLLVIDSPDKVFQTILEMLEHDTGYDNYQRIPIEIAVGVANFDQWARFDKGTLIVEDATIEFVKKHLFYHYNEWYKERYNQSIKSTFVILTESAQCELEPFGRGIYDPIEYHGIRFFAADVNRVQERGRVFAFLEKIGHPSSRLYDSIDRLYIPPLEYPDIKRMLQEKRIVFITGTQEYGKTYTAVRLMWEYYQNGYEPRWIKGNEEIERAIVREKLEEIRAELKPKHIIYFEDPFGKIRYEKRESLERRIGTILDEVARAEDVYAIVTSREEVFKEFEKEELAAREIQDFERRLSIQKPSYDDEKRKAMVVQWAEREDCQWLSNKKLKDLVLESLIDEGLLPTPLSIRDFAVTTVNIGTKPELVAKMREKSVETERAYAKEIEAMADDKVVFLFFPFIGYSEVRFVRLVYEQFVSELGLKDAWEFDRVLDWFKDDKVEIIDGYIEFSHPSYDQAVERLLTQERYAIRTKRQIFDKLLLKLVEKDEAANDVAFTIKDNFKSFREEFRNELLLKLAKKDEAAYAVALIVGDNFKSFREESRNELLLKLAEKDDAAYAVALTVGDNFKSFRGEVRDELLLKLAEKDEVAGVIAWAVVRNFGKLPEDVRNRLLVKLVDKDKAGGAVARAIAHNFDKLPDEVSNLLFKLAGKDKATRGVTWAIVYNFDKLPDEVRNLLFKLAEKQGAARHVARAIAHKFDKLPDNAKNLLFELAERDTAARSVAWAIGDNFDRLPEAVRNLLFKLAEKNRADPTIAQIAEAVRNKFPLKRK